MKRAIVICIVATLLAGAGTAALRAQGSAQAEKLLEGARRRQVVEGDLRGAIDLYAQIVSQFKSQPEIAARALFQLAQCQETLGQAEARKSYERILREYASAAEYVSAARNRLSAMNPASVRAGDLRTQLLWDKAIDDWGTITPDGRLMSFVDWETGDLAVRDLTTGQNRRVTDKGGYIKAEGEAEGNAISPDGKLIAFTWDHWDESAKKEGFFQIRVIGVDGKGERVLVNGPNIWTEPQSWSPDGRWIAAVVQDLKSRAATIILVSPDGTQRRSVATVPNGIAVASTFSPDGRWLAFHTRRANQRAQTPFVEKVYVVPADGSSQTPVEVAASATFAGWVPDGTALLINRRWDERAELHILPFANGRAAGQPRIVAGAPDVRRMLGVTKQGTLIYSNQIQTVDAVVTPFDADTGAIAAFEPEMPVAPVPVIGGVRFSPDGRHVLFVRTRSTLVVRSLADGAERRLSPNMSTVGRVEWAADSRSLIVAGLAPGSPQGLYRVDLMTGAASLLFAANDVTMFAVSPDGNAIYYRKAYESGIPGGIKAHIAAHDVRTGAERVLLASTDHHAFDLSLSPDGKQLAVMGRNELVMLDVATGDTRVRYSNDKDPDRPRFWGIDWTPDGRSLLSVMDITVPGATRTELWKLPAAGGDPIRHRLPGEARGMWVSPGGQRLATLRWTNILQIWSLENFLPPRRSKS